WDAALVHIERLVEHEPKRPDFHDRCGRAHAELWRWAEAAKHFQKATELGADQPGAWYRHALLELHLGHRDAYARACSELPKRFFSSDDVAVDPLAVWTCVLADGTEKDGARAETAKVVAAGERLVAASPNNHARLRTLGAALYRAGRYDDAVRTLDDAIKNKGKENAVL